MDVRKNEMRDLMTEAKEFSQLADGVGICDGQQIYIAEAGLLYNPKPDKQHLDLYKLKRSMRDAWISQVKALSLECQPPKGFSVFGSVSCANKTTFYKMDFVGAFRFYAVNNMVIPLTKKDFGSKIRHCMSACLEFSYLVKEEITRRSTAKPVSFGERQLLQAACAKIPVTSAAQRKLKRTRSKLEGKYPLIYPSFESLCVRPSSFVSLPSCHPPPSHSTYPLFLLLLVVRPSCVDLSTTRGAP